MRLKTLRHSGLVAAQLWRVRRRSPGLWLLLAAVLGLNHLLFEVMALGPRPRYSEQVLAQYWSVLFGTLLLLVPLLTGPALVDSKRPGWSAHPSALVSSAALLLGHLLAQLAIIALWLAATTPMMALIFAYGKVSIGQLMAGYLGLLLVGALAAAIGLWTSALTARAWASAALSGVILTAMMLPWALAQLTAGYLREGLSRLSLYDVLFRGFMEGVVQSQSALSLLILTFGALSLAHQRLMTRRGM